MNAHLFRGLWSLSVGVFMLSAFLCTALVALLPRKVRIIVVRSKTWAFDATPVICLWLWVLSWCLLCSQHPRFLNCERCWWSRWSSVQLMCMLCLRSARNFQILLKHPRRVFLQLMHHTHGIPYYFRWHHKQSRFPPAAFLNGGCCHAPLVSISTAGRTLILSLTASFELSLKEMPLYDASIGTREARIPATTFVNRV